MELNLVHARSFLAVVDFGGFRRAAEALHLTQPSVSEHVRRLEAQLGHALFVRRGRGVEVSPRGEAVARELRALLAAHDGAVARLTQADATGPLVVGVVEHVADPLVPRLAALLRERSGDRPLRLRIERSAPLVAGVAAGEVDVALVVDPGAHPDPTPLGPLALRWWTAAAGPSPDPLPDPVPLVAYTAPCGLRDWALAHLAALGLRTELRAESPHLSGIQAAVRSGLGYALLAEGADGLRPVTSGPLAGTRSTPLWLLLGSSARDLAPDLPATLATAVAAGRAA